MELNNNSNKTTLEVFNRFSNVDDGFIKTQIPIAQIFSGTGPVSRSEARRLGEILAGFAVAELDFSEVEEIGPDFAHELFAVITRSRPELSLKVINANERVAAAIRRAERA